MTLRTKRERIAASNHYRLLYGDGQATPMPERRERKPADPNATPLERDVLKAVWKYLAHHPRIAWITRINSGHLVLDGTRHVHMNYKRGMSDLIGQMKDGRFLAVEVKREGQQLMHHQADFLNEVRLNKGIAFVARSVEDAIEGIPNG